MSKRYQQIQDICVPESYRIEQQEYVAELDSFAQAGKTTVDLSDGALCITLDFRKGGECP